MKKTYIYTMDDIDLRICSQSKCKKSLPPEDEYGFKQCA